LDKHLPGRLYEKGQQNVRVMNIELMLAENLVGNNATIILSPVIGHPGLCPSWIIVSDSAGYLKKGDIQIDGGFALKAKSRVEGKRER